jgi:4-hydroxybenzoate polyprenyltransferase
MRLLDFCFALRPLVLVPAWSFFVLGWGSTAAAGAFPAWRFAALSLVLAASYLVNQIVDRDTDRLNGKGFFLQRGLFTPRTYAIAAAACTLAGLGVAVWSDAAPRRIALAGLLGFAYSVPPLRLAARAGLDLAANAIGYGVLAVWIGAGDASLSRAWIGTGFAVAAVFVHTTLLDLAGDARTGKRTIGVVLGTRMSQWVGLVLAASAVVFVTPYRNAPLIAATVLTAVLVAANAALPRRVSSRTVCVGATAAYALAAAWVAPGYGLAVGALVVATRIYYRARFGLAYPAL